MAVRTIIYLLGGDPLTGVFDTSTQVPLKMRMWLRGCLQARQKARPQHAGELLAEFDGLLKRIGSPYYPRRFVKLAVPTGAATR
jgi:hypothetical protein